jgi:ABC-type lipoprotein release transport system permease subunit
VTAGTSPVRRPPEPKQRRRPLAPPAVAAPSAATLVTIAGIALGAALILASVAVSGGVERSIEKTVEVTLGRADFRIAAPDGGTLSDEMLVTIRSVLGVAVGPAVEQPATLLPEDETAAPSGSPVTILGIDPLVDGQIHDLDLVAGETITRRDEAAAVITERLAANEGYGLGSDVIVATPGEPERFRVVGIAAGDGPIPESDGRTVILPIEAVTRMFGLDGVARVDLLVEEGVPAAGVRAELGEALAGEQYVITSPGDLSESLRVPTAGFATTARGLGAVGTLGGALFIFGAVRLRPREGGEVRSRSLAREAAVHGAIGAGVGATLVFVVAALTRSDVAPAAVGLGGTAAVILVTVLSAVAAAEMPPRPLALTTARRTVVVLAVVLGLVVASATVGANAHRVAAEQAPAPVLGRLVAQIDVMALLAVVIAGAAIVATVAIVDRQPLAPREAGMLGLAGAVLGSIAGLAVAAALIVLGGGRLDLAADVPWAALGVSIVLGIGLSMASAWLTARLGGRLSHVRAVRFG